MPTYYYEHETGGQGCPRGAVFAETQSIKEDAWTVCPDCAGRIERVICPPMINTPTGDSELKDKGFAKLVRRDNGVYENVTAMDHESKVWDARKPETMPDIKKRIRD